MPDPGRGNSACPQFRCRWGKGKCGILGVADQQSVIALFAPVEVAFFLAFALNARQTRRPLVKRRAAVPRTQCAGADCLLSSLGTWFVFRSLEFQGRMTMPYRKGSSVKSHTRTIRTKTGTKRVSVRGGFRKGGLTKPRKR